MNAADVTVIQDALLRQKYPEAERLAAAALQLSRLDGQLWLMLGEALLHQGFGHAARAVFDRAWLFGPGGFLDHARAGGAAKDARWARKKRHRGAAAR
ncbi:hypothetical protein ACHHV8_31795 [Paenibacillus sp. TAB 01]|uniref:hypothetical protein n=1 Tax=Paenibacillus sp. TAB 01 TaxID=3368988 RepID=UPI003753B6DA